MRAAIYTFPFHSADDPVRTTLSAGGTAVASSTTSAYVHRPTNKGCRLATKGGEEEEEGGVADLAQGFCVQQQRLVSTCDGCRDREWGGGRILAEEAEDKGIAPIVVCLVFSVIVP